MKNLIFLFFLLNLLYSNNFSEASKYYENKQYKKAFEIYDKLARKNNANAQYNLALMYYNGIGVTKNRIQAFIWLTTASKLNHKEAQNKLAYMYEKGIIPDIKNIKKALELYKKSANQNYDIAQLNLAMHYAQFINKKSTKKAFYWYTKAFNNNNIVATNNLATMYYFGNGTKKDYKKAAKLYTIAAKANDKLAQYNLAMMYYSGSGIKKDFSLAHKWLKKSAINGNKLAQLKLGHFYRQGNNLVNQDYNKALYWYFKAAAQKYPPAQYYVGFCYYNGYGIKKDIQKATYWMYLSSKNGYKFAKDFMKRNKLYY